eukprot:6470035-Pyramimonas_sp.AAC.1
MLFEAGVRKFKRRMAFKGPWPLNKDVHSVVLISKSTFASRPPGSWIRLRVDATIATAYLVRKSLSARVRSLRC